MKTTLNKPISHFVATLLLLSFVCFNTPAFAVQEEPAQLAAAAVPTITAPSVSNIARANLPVKWSAIAGATYVISLRDLSVNMLVFSNLSVPTSSGSSYTIDKKYFYEGHQYRLAVGATVNGTTTWAQKDVYVVLSSARNTILDRAAKMNSYTWTPTQQLLGWQKNFPFSAGNTYTGIPYTQATQCSISSVTWVGNRYFNTELANSSNNSFYVTQSVVKSPTETWYMPTFGSDCSGYTSVAYNISRESTWSLPSSRTRVGTSIESRIKAYARLSPGDILNDAGSHVVVIKEITAINKADGSLDYIKFTTVEQTPYWCQSKERKSNELITDGYEPFTKDTSTAQDYTWNWVS